ncbi:MAG TPA: Hpt domain-containing protein [Gemmatimonadaceae bacterium]|jgi:HPt (histidine-containing phosphotransfer) domain-containing protein
MSGPAGFLEFFILEASDYVEQLDRLLLGGNSSGLDAEGLQRTARALRGTATMAKMPSFAELASGVERAGRALHDGALQWSPALSGVLVAAIDDLKTLLHSARTWSAADDERAASRTAELARFVPTSSAPVTQSVPTVGVSTGDSSFLATEATNIAAGVELVVTRPEDTETAANVLRRVRALRGVASVSEVQPLADVLEATENAARGIETGTPMRPDERQLLQASGAYLRSLAAVLRAGGNANETGPQRDAFVAAHDAWLEQDVQRDVVVPIADLFYPDGASGIIEASQNPPTSAPQRFRLELVSLGEHLRRVVQAARANADPQSATRARRDVQRALRTAQAAAESYGETEIAEFIGGHVRAADTLDFLGLATLDDLAGLLSDPGSQGERIKEHLGQLAGGRDLASAIGTGFSNDETVIAKEEPMPAMPEHLDSASASLIDSTIAALDSLSDSPFSQPVPIPEDAIVSIESLLYRGRAALDRAVEIRDQLRGAPTSDPTALEELFDLLELARAE